MAARTATADGGGGSAEETRRDFLYLATGAATALGGALMVWPLIDNMNPSADVLALSTTEVDLAPIEIGQSITVVWQGKPVFVDHRTEQQIAAAREVDLAELPDPQADEDRVQKAEWLIMIGICTHLGCIPKGQKTGDPIGEFGGWLCVCHGSQYDTSGRIRRGPAPNNLDIPPYQFVEDLKIQIG